MLALFGAFHEGVKGRPGTRPYAAAFLVAVASLFVAGVFLVVRKTWRGPYPHYFESYLWPCYAVYAAKGAEKAWLADKRADTAFLQKLMTFGNFVHGSHVAGISAARCGDPA